MSPGSNSTLEGLLRLENWVAFSPGLSGSHMAKGIRSSLTSGEMTSFSVLDSLRYLRVLIQHLYERTAGVVFTTYAADGSICSFIQAVSTGGRRMKRFFPIT